MKLASIKSGRDGRLVVVSENIAWATEVGHIAPTLQHALDHWSEIAPRLEEVAYRLKLGGVPTFRFHEHDCAAPLPRAYQWLDGSAYLNHAALLRRAHGADLPESYWSDPLIYQGCSDGFHPPRAPIHVATEAFGVDFEAEVAVVIDDVPMGASREQAAAAIRLVMLANDISLRNLMPAELTKGFGFVQSKPSPAFSPVAVTPDELGAAWDGGKLRLPLLSFVNGRLFGQPDAGVDMAFDFPALIVHAAKTRALAAGTIIGSGTVSNRDASGAPGRSIEEGGVGYSCIAELRSAEIIRHGAPKTPYLAIGDLVRIEMKDAGGHSIFGAVEQEVVKA